MAEQSYEILIVEDNPDDAELMIRSLKKNKLANNLIVVEDGEQALDYLFCSGKYDGRQGCKPPELILLDLKLPKVSGLEVLKRIKSDASTRKIPVIIITSSREDPDISAAYDLGANSYVVKPVDFEHFMSTVSQLGIYWLAINEKPK